MANIIKPKRTTTPGNNPTTANLAEGEIAINLADRRLFVRDTSNNILQLPGATDSLDIDNDLTVNGSINGTSQINLPSGLTPLAITSDFNTLSATTKIFPVNLLPQAGWFLATTFLTENNENVARFVAADTGGGDDGSHDAGLILHGGSNYIRSLAEAGFGTPVDLTVEANNITLQGDTGNNGNIQVNGNDITLQSGSILTLESNGPFNMSANNGGYIFAVADSGHYLLDNGSGSRLRINNSPQIRIRPDYNQLSADTWQYVRHNSSDGVNDSSIADGSEVKFNFQMQSADNAQELIIGGMTATAHSVDGNSYNISLDDYNQNGEVNSLVLWEDKVTVGQVFVFKEFNSDPTGVPDGSVYYNAGTQKLRLKAGGTWVDLN